MAIVNLEKLAKKLKNNRVIYQELTKAFEKTNLNARKNLNKNPNFEVEVKNVLKDSNP